MPKACTLSFCPDPGNVRTTADRLGTVLRSISVNGATLAILFHLEFPLPALRGIAILCHTAGLIGQAERPIGFILSMRAAEAVVCDGPRPA